MTENLVLPDWMGNVDPNEIGFPFALDRRRYTKRPGIRYKDTPAGPLQLDAYRPSSSGLHPLVVMIHGGGWASGGRFDMGLTKWAGYLASAGLAVISIDYRLAPVSHYPEPFQDCLDAVDWGVEHASELGADAEKIGLWGDSAGGHLALLLALTQTNPAFTGPRLRCAGDRLRAAVLLYPPTDLLRLDRAEQRKGDPSGMVRNFLGVPPDRDPARWREASPVEQIHAQAPPLLLLQGSRDLLVPHRHTASFAERFTAAGGRCEFHVVENGLHGFDRLAPGPRECKLIERAREFLCLHLEVAAGSPRTASP